MASTSAVQLGAPRAGLAAIASAADAPLPHFTRARGHRVARSFNTTARPADKKIPPTASAGAGPRRAGLFRLAHAPQARDARIAVGSHSWAKSTRSRVADAHAHGEAASRQPPIRAPP